MQRLDVYDRIPNAMIKQQSDVFWLDLKIRAGYSAIRKALFALK